MYAWRWALAMAGKVTIESGRNGAAGADESPAMGA